MSDARREPVIRDRASPASTSDCDELGVTEAENASVAAQIAATFVLRLVPHLHGVRVIRRVVYGEGIWSRPPTVTADLLDLATDHGFAIDAAHDAIRGSSGVARAGMR